MDLNTRTATIHWVEVVLATLVVGVILVSMATGIRSALTRERDAARTASVAAVRGALEEYVATKGEYPRTENPVLISGGCVDTEKGLLVKAERGQCAAAILAIPEESSSAYALYYQSSADAKGYAVSFRAEQSKANYLVCATSSGIAVASTCSPAVRSVAQ